eukprot:1678730-Amphidinium_carterae.2
MDEAVSRTLSQKFAAFRPNLNWGRVTGQYASDMGDALPVVNLGTGMIVTAISAGDALHACNCNGFNCALLEHGAVKCWGNNTVGQLGLGDTTDRGTQSSHMGDVLPSVDFGTGVYAIALDVGASFACALLDTDFVKCWGDNSYGQLGLGPTGTPSPACLCEAWSLWVVHVLMRSTFV